MVGSDLVFVGRVTHVDRLGERFQVAVSFVVERMFKGGGGAEVIVQTASSSAACGYLFDEGESYLVYARRGADGFSTSSCTRTRPLAAAREDLAAFDALAKQGLRWHRLRPAFGAPTLVLGGVEDASVTIESCADLATWEPMENYDVAPAFVQIDAPERGEGNLFRARAERVRGTGIYGQVVALPGICMEDPDNPGQCLNPPFPGSGSYVVRAHSDEPDLGITNPILASFETVAGGEGFSVDGIHQEALDRGVISAPLWQALASGGVTLSRHAVVSVEAEYRFWVIHDPVSLKVLTVSAESRGAPELTVLESGWFRVPLDPGRYCIWEGNNCTQVEVAEAEWSFKKLVLALP